VQAFWFQLPFELKLWAADRELHEPIASTYISCDRKKGRKEQTASESVSAQMCMSASHALHIQPDKSNNSLTKCVHVFLWTHCDYKQQIKQNSQAHTVDVNGSVIWRQNSTQARDVKAHATIE